MWLLWVIPGYYGLLWVIPGYYGVLSHPLYHEMTSYDCSLLSQAAD